MRVKIIKIQGNPWYGHLKHCEFDVEPADDDAFYKIVSGSERSHLLLKSDCQVIWGNGCSFKPIHKVVEDGIKALAEHNTKDAAAPFALPVDYVHVENVFVVASDGRKYRLVPENETTPAAETKEPELKTYSDCLFKVDPRFYLNNLNEVCSCNGPQMPGDIRDQNMFPTIKNGKQIQAAIKLFVIQYALNDGEYNPVEDHQDPSFVSWEQPGGLTAYSLSDFEVHSVKHNPYAFKRIDLARKAIEIGKDTWLDYFGIER